MRPIARRAASLTLIALLGTACIEGGSSTEDPVDAAPPGRLADVMADVGVDGMMADATRDALADAGVDAMVGPMGDAMVGPMPDAMVGPMPDAMPDVMPDAEPDAEPGRCPGAAPDPLVFRSLVRRTDDRLVRIQPCPGRPLDVLGARLSDDSDPGFALGDAVPEPGDPLAVRVRFELFNAARVTGRLIVDTDQGPIEVPLVGDARENACPEAAGRVPRLMRVQPLDVVLLDGREALDLDGFELRPVAWHWVVVQRPVGSVSQPHEAFYNPVQPADGGLDDDVETPAAVFFADLPGIYRLELRLRDALGLEARLCGTVGRTTLVVGDPPGDCGPGRPCDDGACREGFCTPPPCARGVRRRCHAPCGEGWQVCGDEVWEACVSEAVDERCHDGLDGDCDGRVDEGCAPVACVDGVDQDDDGVYDFPTDPGCAAPGDVDEGGRAGVALPACSNGFDDDRDGRIDLDDPGCASAADPLEADAADPPGCSDGRDDDGDGAVDYPDDPGCAAAGDFDEEDPPVAPQCDNGRDDDGDGRVDYPDDPGCSGRGVRDEADPPGPPPCADGRDNDGDGRIDFPDDPQCASARGGEGEPG